MKEPLSINLGSPTSVIYVLIYIYSGAVSFITLFSGGNMHG